MNTDLVNTMINAYLQAIRDGIVIAERGQDYAISLPFLTAGGHFVQIWAEEKAPNFVVLSDKGGAIGELWLSGLSGLKIGKKKRIIEKVVQEYNLHVEENEIVMQANIADIGKVIHSMVQALLRIDDLRILHRIPVVKEEKMQKRLRRILTGTELHDFCRKEAIVRGKEVANHTVDLIVPNEDHKTAVKGIDRQRDLETLVEAWAFKFEDMRRGEPNLRLIALFDEQNDRWTDDLFDVMRKRSKLLPIQDEAGLLAQLRSGQ